MNPHPNFWRYEADVRDSEHHAGESISPDEGGSHLPHERDESPENPADAHREKRRLRDVIRQAARDVFRGLRDTERRGVPSDVPGPHGDAPPVAGPAAPDADASIRRNRQTRK